jgi:hypothetical protein
MVIRSQIVPDALKTKAIRDSTVSCHEKEYYLPAIDAKFPHMSSIFPEFAQKKRILYLMTHHV